MKSKFLTVFSMACCLTMITACGGGGGGAPAASSSVDSSGATTSDTSHTSEQSSSQQSSSSSKQSTTDESSSKEEEISVTISFYDGSELIQKFEGVAGDDFRKPKQPKKDGYLFKGWAFEGSEIAATLPDVMPKRNMSFYAIWEIKTYNLVFRDNVMFNGTYSYGDNLPQLEPTQLFETFIGWQVKGADSDPINRVYDMGELDEWFFLVPIFSKHTFNIVFEDTNIFVSDKQDVFDPQRYTSSTEITEIPTNIELKEEGKYLVGWSIIEDREGDEYFIGGDTLASLPYETLFQLEDYLDEDTLHLWPVVANESYRIIYHDFDGDVIYEDDYEYGDQLLGNGAYFSYSSNADYVTDFYGWSQSQYEDIYVDNSGRSLLDSVIDFGRNGVDVDVYAVVQGLTYSIQFSITLDNNIHWTSSTYQDKYSGTVSMIPNEEFPGDEAIEKDGYTFVGWKSGQLKDSSKTYKRVPNLPDLVREGVDLKVDTIVFRPVFEADAIRVNLTYASVVDNGKDHDRDPSGTSCYLINNDYRFPATEEDSKTPYYMSFMPLERLPDGGTYGIRAAGFDFQGWYLFADKESTSLKSMKVIPNDYRTTSQGIFIRPGEKMPTQATIDSTITLDKKQVLILAPVFAPKRYNIPIFEQSYEYIKGNVKRLGTFSIRSYESMRYRQYYDLENNLIDVDGQRYLFKLEDKNNIKANRMYATMYNQITGAMKESYDDFHIDYLGQCNYERFKFLGQDDVVIQGTPQDKAWYISRFLLQDVG